MKIKEKEKTEKYLDLARELKKTVDYESDNDTNRDQRGRNSVKKHF